jgi:hypothetical protein
LTAGAAGLLSSMGTSLRFRDLAASYQLSAVSETQFASDICCLAERILHR